MRAARALLELLEELERSGTSVIDLVRAGQPLEPWRLYPDESGVFDRDTRYLWAIGDAYASAGHLKLYARRVHLPERAGAAPLVRFVHLVFEAFRPEIERLQEDKIAALARHRVRDPHPNVFEDRSLEVLSRVELDIRARAGVGAAAISRS
jgi:hypothetical protein